MLYWWQRVIAVLAAMIADLFISLFVLPQLFTTYDNYWLSWALEITILIAIYVLVTKLFKHVNKVNNASDWAKQNNELTATSSGEVYKAPEKALVFKTVSELISKENIADLHYTTLFVFGHLITEGSKHYIIEIGDSFEVARLEALFDGDIPVITDEVPHNYQGTLMVENGRTFLQWTKLCQ